MPWRRAVVLGFAEQAANVLLPAGGVGGPAFGAFVLTQLGVPAGLAASGTPRCSCPRAWSASSRCSRRALARVGVLPGDDVARCDADPGGRRRGRDRAGARVRAEPTAAGLGRGKSAPRCGSVRCSSTTGRARRVELLRHGDRLLVFGAVAYYAVDVAALACGFQAFGGGAPPIGVFILAYTLGHAGALLPTPGGVGGTEGGLIGMFVAYGTPSRPRRRRRARLPRLPARPPGRPRRRRPPARPPHPRPPAPARGRRRPLRRRRARRRGVSQDPTLKVAAEAPGT